MSDRLDRICYWNACVYVAMGQREYALSELESAVERGFWWNSKALLEDNDLRGLEQEERFKEIISVCEEIFAREKQTTKVAVKCVGNPNAETFIISLHWKAANIEDFSSYWLTPALEEEYYYIFIQSSQVCAYNSYCWDDSEVAQKDVLEALSHFGLKGKKIILAGASQGATLAIDLVLKEEVQAEGFLAIVPSIRDVEALNTLVERKEIKDKKGYILTGTKDPFYEQSVKGAHFLHYSGIQCELLIIEEMGHLFPPNFTCLLPGAIKIILT